MGLFDKKNCDICGESIGLLGNKKLEDGNMCKDCAKKLSPWFDERRHSTVEQIKNQLIYREENSRKLSSFRPSRVFGNSTKVHVDEANRKFIVTYASNWIDANPDIVDFGDVISCDTDIREDRNEIYRSTTADGKRESYDPPRYEYSYTFNTRIMVNNPYFDEISFELSGENPDSPYTELYRQYEREAYELKNVLTSGAYNGGQNSYNASGNNYGANQNNNMNNSNGAFVAGGNYQNSGNVPPQGNSASWQCACGTVNSGNFCSGCGNQKPANTGWQCPNCGTVNTGNFCSGCGRGR